LNPENERLRNTKRTSLEILTDILEFCAEPRALTQVTHKTDLSHKALKAYMARLCKLSLISQDSQKYVTTKKGRQFVLSLTNLENMLENSDSTLSADNSRKMRK